MEAYEIVAITDQMKTDWLLRDEAQEKDLQLIRVTQDEKPGYETIRTNEARAVFDTSRALLSTGGVKFTLPIAQQAPEEKEKMNKAERFCDGILRELNKTQLLRGHGPFLQELAHWALSGWIAGFPHVEEEDGKPVFHCDLYDPFQVYYDTGPKGLTRVARIYSITRQTAEDMAAAHGWDDVFLDANAEEAEIRNYWWLEQGKVMNAVLLQGAFVKNPTEYEDSDHIPVLVLPVNGSPQRAWRNDPLWREHVGESIIAANREVLPKRDRLLQFLMQMAKDAADPYVVEYTADGQPAHPEKKPGAQLAYRIGEKLELLRAINAPMAEITALTGQLNANIQKNWLPDTAFGTTNFPLSGYAIGLLKPLEHILGPYQEPIDFFLSETFMTFLRQFRKGKFKPVTLAGRRGGALEGYLQEDFKREDIPEVSFIEVKTGINIGSDRMQNVAMAVQLKQTGLLSDETLMTDYLNVADVALERERIMMDQIDEVLAKMKFIEELKRRAGIEYLRNNVERGRFLETTALRLEMALGGSPDVGRKPGGLPPTMLPPEAGLNNPDEANAMMGLAPPAMPARRGLEVR